MGGSPWGVPHGGSTMGDPHGGSPMGNHHGGGEGGESPHRLTAHRGDTVMARMVILATVMAQIDFMCLFLEAQLLIGRHCRRQFSRLLCPPLVSRMSSQNGSMRVEQFLGFQDSSVCSILGLLVPKMS